MSTQTLTCVVGEAKTGEVATIRFFGKITEDSTNQFNQEFDYLETVVRPSLIRVLINSEGGSVLYGMTTYSTIRNSKIPTECIIEGMAASMASIIWAAGGKSLMRDYSILMIHFSRLPNHPEASESDLVTAFANQIKTIYRKRFGLSMDKIQEIMDGAPGKDGTFFDATGAVQAGIIPKDYVIETSKQLCDKVKNEIKDYTKVEEIQSLMSRITMEFESSKHFPGSSPTCYQSETINNQNPMKEMTNPTPEYSAVVASLGMKENIEMKDVVSRITDLLSKETKLQEVQNSLRDAQTVIAGKEAAIQNLQTDLDKVTASLAVYQEKEDAAKQESIKAMVQAAVDTGKIDASTAPQWIAMAEANLELAEKTLASIPAREQISQAIASDAENIQTMQNSTKTVEQQMAETVAAVVGENFEFKKLD